MSVVEADNVLEDFGATRTGFSQEQGTGLGLPLCRRIVEGIGGTLVLESVEGAGTTATVNLLLPVCQAPRCCEESGLDSCSRALKRMLVAAGSPGVTADVLVADDSALCRMVYERVLGRLGLRYECVPDGEDVVRRIRGGATYGLLLLDEEMAHMCGSTACDEVRTIGYTGAAVLVTANELSAPERDRAHWRIGAGRSVCQGPGPRLLAGPAEALDRLERHRERKAPVGRWAPHALAAPEPVRQVGDGRSSDVYNTVCNIRAGASPALRWARSRRPLL